MPQRSNENKTNWKRAYENGECDADDAQSSAQHFSKRSKFAQHTKMQRTADQRALDVDLAADVDTLPLGEVTQVFSRYSEVRCGETIYLATLRRTVQKLTHMAVVVGDFVHVRPGGTLHESGMPEAVIERVLPRQTLLLRQDSFRKDRVDPIVANAHQMLVVTSILKPRVKWGLVDRMLIAAQSGGLQPIVCLNKMDLAAGNAELLAEADQAIGHYASMEISTLQTSTSMPASIELLKELLVGRKTVLAGHSGVGKSTLIMAMAPELDIRTAAVSAFNDKGRHTTTSARRYPLPFGGEVIDTPGIKQFGLMGLNRESLMGFFPDVEAGTAPEWRVESFERIAKSL